MTKTEITKIARQEDHDGTLSAKLFTALRTASDDDLQDLVAQIAEAGRTTAVEDITSDLAEFGETEAIEIIKTNY